VSDTKATFSGLPDLAGLPKLTDLADDQRLLGHVHPRAWSNPRAAPTPSDFAAALAQVRDIRADIAVHDSAARLREAGVDVFLGDARFAGPDTVAVDGQTLRFARAVIATGARAALPPIPGLADVRVLTNETVFALTERPARVAVVGGGPIGCELAQALNRLGSQVRLFDVAPRLLGKDDPDAAAIVARRLQEEGVVLTLGARLLRCERGPDGAGVIVFERGAGEERRGRHVRRARVLKHQRDAAINRGSRWGLCLNSTVASAGGRC
jgi:pyruvate/2-oxoglutarate dehydrogenase complex dihydrolipoamide dehydrogenase (E3) component